MKLIGVCEYKINDRVVVGKNVMGTITDIRIKKKARYDIKYVQYQVNLSSWNDMKIWAYEGNIRRPTPSLRQTWIAKLIKWFKKITK